MQFSKLILVNSEKIKRPLKLFFRVHLFVSADYCCCISYQEKVLRLTRTSIKSTKMQNANVRISKRIKLQI